MRGRAQGRRGVIAGVAGGLLVLGAFGVALSGGPDDTRASPVSGSGSGATPIEGCVWTATTDCTPHVAFDRHVRVDGLIWNVKAVRVTAALRPKGGGLGATANGRFVIVDVKVHSDRAGRATLSEREIQLEAGGDTYDADGVGSAAAIRSDRAPFFLQTIAPGRDRTGVVVFDVPVGELARSPQLRLNELGLGGRHAYIRLPAAAFAR